MRKGGNDNSMHIIPYHGSGFYPDSDFSDSVLDALIAKQRAQLSIKKKQKNYTQLTISELYI